MKTIELKIYSFDELSNESQKKAINNLSDINIDYNWWEGNYEDATNIGLKIEEFDLYDRYHIKGKFINSAIDTANKIIEHHGVTCDTFELAIKYQDDYNTACNNGDLSCFTDNVDNDFLKELLKCYYKQLQNEYHYRVSKDAIIETIESNEYEFTENGKLFN